MGTFSNSATGLSLNHTNGGAMKRFAILLFLLMTSVIFAQTYVSGAVSGVWDSTGSPYYVTGFTYVSTSDSLIIGPGTEIIFQGHHSIRIANAVLRANGTETDSINFLAQDSTVGHCGLVFTNNLEPSILEYCTFSHGHADSGSSHELMGGAIFIDLSEVHISRCSFRNNRASQGGALTSKQAILFIDNTTFEENLSQMLGGALCLSEMVMCSISQSSFSSDSGCDRGGALYIFDSERVIVEECIFHDNFSRYGGAVFSSDNDTLIFSKCTFIENRAFHGGAVNAKDNLTIFDDCLFELNYASMHGGALNFSYADSVVIHNCSFFRNSCVQRGGAIYAFQYVVISLDSSLIEDNQAQAGGACFISEVENLFIEHSRAKDNIATTDGGGFYVHECHNVLINGTRISSNESANGGGVFLTRSDATIQNTIISDNHSSTCTGGLYCYSGVQYLVNSTIINNTSDAEIGGIRVNSAFYALNSIIAGNEATSYDDVYLYSGRVKFKGCFLDRSGLWPSTSFSPDSLYIGVNFFGNYPRFSDTLYNLANNSNCINLGAYELLDATAPDVDIEGNPRPVGISYDAGAYEFIGTPLNRSPFFYKFLPDTTVAYNDSLVLEICAYDLDGDLMSYILRIDDSSTVTDSITKIKPSHHDIGMHYVEIYVHDGYESDTMTFNMEVVSFSPQINCDYENDTLVKINYDTLRVDVQPTFLDSLRLISPAGCFLEGDSVIVCVMSEIDSGLYEISLVAYGFSTNDTMSFYVHRIFGTLVSGPLSGVWDSTGSPYLVNGFISVQHYDSLIIEPGVKVVFMNTFHFSNIGHSVFKARGTEENRIVFTALDTTAGFGGMIIHPENSCSLAYCDFHYAKAISDFRTCGGAILLAYAPLVLEHCRFYSCRASDKGGAISAENTYLIARNCLFQDCISNNAGGIYTFETNSRIENCIFKNCKQGSLHLNGGFGEIANSTFQNSYAQHLRAWYGAKAVVYNCIFGDMVTGYEMVIRADPPCSIAFANNCMDSAGIYHDLENHFEWHSGIFDTDTIFADDECRLIELSPCVDAGVESLYSEIFDSTFFAPEFDYEGVLRPIGSGYDLGAYETPATHFTPIITLSPPALSAYMCDTVFIDIDILDWDDSTWTIELIGPDDAYVMGDSLLVWFPLFEDIGVHTCSLIVCDDLSCDTGVATITVQYKPIEWAISPRDTFIAPCDTLRARFAISRECESPVSYRLSGAPPDAYIEGDSVIVWVPDYEDTLDPETYFAIVAEDTISSDFASFRVWAFEGTRVVGSDIGVWTADGSPYRVYGVIDIACSLIIKPGVEVVAMTDSAYLWARYGEVFKAIGTEDSVITFGTRICDSIVSGGIYLDRAANSCSLAYCEFQNCAKEHGGAIYSNRTDISIRECSFNTCSANNKGGAVYSSTSKCEISNSEFHNNQAHIGGALVCESNSPFITNSSFISNRADTAGAIYMKNSPYATLMNNRIRRNLFTALYFQGDTLDMTGNIITDNAIACNLRGHWFSSVNNTICRNSGSGIDIVGMNTFLFNTILRDNGSLSTHELLVTDETEAVCSLFVNYSNIDTSRWVLDTNTYFILGDYNTTGDPMVDSTGHLDTLSACIDSGALQWRTELAELIAPFKDIDGDPIPIGYAADIGADEAEITVSENIAPVVLRQPDSLSVFNENPSAPPVALPLITIDPNGDSLSYTINGHPDPYVIGDSLFFWDNDSFSIGRYDFEVIASDGYLSDTAYFSIEIYMDYCGPVFGVWDSTRNPHRIHCDVYIPPGDTLIIEPGVEVLFEGEFSFVVGSAAVLKAMGTAEDSIIFHSNSSVLNGGLDFISASAECELNYCRISNSTSSGIYTSNSDISISNCEISGNSYPHGGGIRISNSNLLINHCTIRDNHAGQNGGGIDITNSDVVIYGSKILNNLAQPYGYGGSGGGLSILSSNVDIIDCAIENNTTRGASGSDECSNGEDGYGGGIMSTSSTIVILNSVMKSNRVRGGSGAEGYHCAGRGGDSYGGGIYDLSSNITIGNCLIIDCCASGGYSPGYYDWWGEYYPGNPGNAYGGFIYGNNSTIKTNNSTLVSNSPETYYSTGSDAIVINTAFSPGYENKFNSSNIIGCYSNFDPSDGHSGAGEVIDIGCFLTDPGFVDPASGDFHLHSTSALIDAGAETVYVEYLDTTFYAPVFDIDGNTRPRGETWDIGAYESPYSSGSRPPYFLFCPEDTIVPAYSTVCMYFSMDDPDGDYISTSAIGADGSFLEDDTVLTWTPSIEDTSLNEISIIITDSIFYDTCSFVIDVRACGFPLAGAISGTLHVDDSPYCIFDDVYVPSGETLLIDPGVRFNFWGNYEFRIDSAAVLKARGTPSDSIVFTACDTIIARHGGLRFIKADPCSLKNVRISDGYSTQGGALKVVAGDLFLIDCNINYNRASNAGGGLYADTSYIYLIGSDFTHNFADTFGGGLAVSTSEVELIDNNISHNKSNGSGGGCMFYGSNIRSYGNRFIADSCVSGAILIHECSYDGFGDLYDSNIGLIGGAIYWLASDGRLINCIFNANIAVRGGGIYLSSSPHIEFINTVFSKNTAGFPAPGGGHYVGDGGGLYCTLTEPKIYNCLFYKNIANTNSDGGAIFCRNRSYPVIINSVLYGDSCEVNGKEIYLDYSEDSLAYPCSLSIFNSLIDISKCEYAEGSYIQFGDGVFYDDPMFVDTLAEDFRLMRTSPCISAGAESVYVGIYHDSVFYAPNYDLLMNPRPNGLAPDIGPYEFFGPNSAPLFDNCPLDTALTSWLDTIRYALSISDLDGDHISLFLADTAPGTHLFDTTLYIALPEVADTGEFEVKIVACDPWACDTCAFLIYIPETIEEYYAVPRDFDLFVLPNPFNSSVTILTPAHAEIEIYDVMGRRVLTDRTKPAGKQGNSIIDSDSEPGVFIWRPDDKTRSGVYFVRAKSENVEIVRRAVYLK